MSKKPLEGDKSTSITSPMIVPILSTFFKFIQSCGIPITWIQNGYKLKSTSVTTIPGWKGFKTKKAPLNVQGYLSIVEFPPLVSSNSKINVFLPSTFTLTSSQHFQIRKRKFIVISQVWINQSSESSISKMPKLEKHSHVSSIARRKILGIAETNDNSMERKRQMIVAKSPNHYQDYQIARKHYCFSIVEQFH